MCEPFPVAQEAKKNFSCASERKKQGDTCAAQRAFTLFTNALNCGMSDEPRNDPLTHSWDTSQRVRRIGGCGKVKKGDQIPPPFPVLVPFHRLCELCVDGGDACGAFNRRSSAMSRTIAGRTND